MLRYIDERGCLEKERELVRSSLANLRKERKEIREELSACQGTSAIVVAHETCGKKADIDLCD